MLVNYRTAVRSGGDLQLPKVVWKKRWDELGIGVSPIGDQDMTFADLFFALGWIWTYMAVPKAEFDSPYRDFRERCYVVYRHEGDTSVAKGYIRFGYHWIGQAGLDGFLNTTSAATPPTEGNTTDVALSSELPLPSTILAAYPNPFPIPGSNVILQFGPPKALPSGPLRPVIYMLLSILQEAWALMAANKGITLFPPTNRFDSAYAIHIAVEPRRNFDRITPLTTSIVADSVWGIVYYMLNEGVFGGRIGIFSPGQHQGRVNTGIIHINDPVGPAVPAVETS
ncbi:MAG: hypothetical protein Q9213_004239 [Squamulea squamosa]